MYQDEKLIEAVYERPVTALLYVMLTFLHAVLASNLSYLENISKLPFDYQELWFDGPEMHFYAQWMRLRI